MASSKSPDLSTKPIRFFKIILSDIGSRSKLMIPRNFARIFGENLKDSILLHAPNGSVWSIDLERHEGGVWLQNGWPEFAKFYSICVGYLLVLEYQGDSRFQLLIFDPSSSEIDYPLASSDKLNSVKLNQMVIDIEDSTSFDDSTSCDDNSSSSGDAVRPCKKMKTNSPHVEAKLQQEAKEDGDRALASAQAYKSKNPFFIQPMKPSNIGYRRWPSLHVTKTFEEAYENWKNNDKIILQVAGRTWAVYCSLNLGSNHCRISRGWNKFVRDNSLNVCDVCVFELINPSKKVLQVAIFRAAKEKNCGENKRSPRVSEAEEAGVRASVTVRSCKKTSGNSLRVDACRKRPKSRKQNEVGNGEWGEDKALALAKAFISKNPFFITVMHPFHVNGRGTGLYITKTFGEAYKKWKKGDEVIFQVGGRTWQVYCNVNLVLNQCRISGGWNGFARDNLMNVGDVCVFELINTSRKLFNVSIFRADKETTFGDNRLQSIRIDAEQARVYKSVKAFKSENPFFTVKVCPSYLYGGSVCLAKSFIKRYVTEDQCDVILQLADRRVWSVKCRVYKATAKFDAGWSMFARESNLAAAGFCVFELIHPSKKLFNVIII